MPTYVIGDIQGCYKTFRLLLKRCNFNSKKDRLWIAGDLINRGPQSLDVLRYVRDLGNQAQCVIGNHEIMLLAVSQGLLSHKDTQHIDPILKAPDGAELIDWVRHWPLIHRENKFVLVHAGILPCWSVNQALHEAQAIQKILQSDQLKDFLIYIYAHQESRWNNDAKGFQRHALALHSFVHMRLCNDAQTMHFGFSDKPENAPKGSQAWYTFKGRKSLDHTILFGHWSALGLRAFANCIALDSGCVWGEALSAYRLEDGAFFVEKSAES